MSSDISIKSNEAYKTFSALFSQKPAVSAKRMCILQAISKSAKGKMKFREVFREIQSMMNDVYYSSQKLTYDLHVLRDSGLINQAWDGEYTITDNGASLLAMYHEIATRLEGPKKLGKTGFVGEVNGKIRASGFDLNLLGEELARFAFFRRKFVPGRDKFCLEIRDSDSDFISDVEIKKSGHFNVRVVLYRDDQSETADFLSDFEKSSEWYETAKGITQTVVYYIKRTARRVWRDSEIDVSVEPDSYPI